MKLKFFVVTKPNLHWTFWYTLTKDLFAMSLLLYIAWNRFKLPSKNIGKNNHDLSNSDKVLWLLSICIFFRILFNLVSFKYNVVCTGPCCLGESLPIVWLFWMHITNDWWNLIKARLMLLHLQITRSSCGLQLVKELKKAV